MSLGIAAYAAMLVSATTNAEIAKLDESHKATREQRVSQRTTRGTGPLAAFHQGLENLADGIYRPRT